MKIPARLRPHIRNSFSYQLGYSEKEAIIYMIQSQLEEADIKNQRVLQLRDSKTLWEKP